MKNATVRTVREEDADAFLDMCLQLDEESDFLMLEPGERPADVEYTLDRIRQVLVRSNQTILVAEHPEDGLVGYVAAYGGDHRRSQHCARLVTAVKQAYTGRGLGTILFMELERWARKNGIHRLELTVMLHNRRAVELYKKTGFKVEGIREHSMFLHDEYVNEYYMAKLL